jgi:hypothetical protein
LPETPRTMTTNGSLQSGILKIILSHATDVSLSPPDCLHQRPPLEGDWGAGQGGCLRVCPVPFQRIWTANKDPDRFVWCVQTISNYTQSGTMNEYGTWRFEYHRNRQ